MAQAARRPGVNVFDESKPMWQLLGVFLLPLVATNILQTASQTMSAIWISRLIGVQALGAISSVFPIIFLLVSFLIGIASGSTVLIGQAYGARDEHRVKRVAGTALGVALYLGVAIAILGYFIAPALLSLLATPKDIFAEAEGYAKAVFLTFPVLFPYIVYTMFLRGTGDSTTPFQALIVSSLLVILITPLFIWGTFGLPKLGIISAAVASAIASAIALSWLVWHLGRIQHVLRFDREMLADMIVDWKLLGAIVRIGIPTGIQIIMISLAEVAVLSFVNRFGSHATAAYGAVNQVVSYVQFPAISISIAASIFGAQCIGAKRSDKLGSVIRSAVGLNYAVEIFLILVCYTFSWQVLGWFITAPNTLAVAHALLAITLWSYALYGNWAVLSGIMRGSGDVIWPTAIGIFAIWGFEVPAAYLLMHRFGLDGVWMGYPIAFCAGLAMQFCYYEFVWKRKTHERLV